MTPTFAYRYGGKLRKISHKIKRVQEVMKKRAEKKSLIRTFTFCTLDQMITGLWERQLRRFTIR